MSVFLRQGDRAIRLDLLDRWGRPPVVAPDAFGLRALARGVAGVTADPSAEAEPSARLEHLLDDAEGIDRFTSRAPTARRVALTLPDATRRGPWEAWAEPVMRWLTAHTPEARFRTMLVATGVHRPDQDARFTVPEGWTRIANGEGHFESHVEVGRTPAGTLVRLHPAWADADLRIALADVSYHYFAGFGGGRKLVFPGLAEPTGIMANHRRSLTASGTQDPHAGPGRLADNPVHQDLCEAASLCPPDLLVQVFDPGRGQPLCLELGSWRELHELGCVAYDRGHRVAHTCTPDLLVADAGGRPRDASFLQAHKSLQHASRFLSDGGRLLLVAALDQGLGSETLAELIVQTPAALAASAVSDYRLHTHTALALRNVCERIEVGLWCRGPIEALRETGIAVLTDQEEALAWAERDGRPKNWGWLSRAEEYLPELVGRAETDQNEPEAAEEDPEEAGE